MVPWAAEHGESSTSSSRRRTNSPPAGTKLGELGRSPGSREEPCSWVSRAMEGGGKAAASCKLPLPRPLMLSSPSPTQGSWQSSRRISPGRRHRDKAARAHCAEHWYEYRPAGALHSLLKEIENAWWEQEAVVLGPVSSQRKTAVPAAVITQGTRQGAVAEPQKGRKGIIRLEQSCWHYGVVAKPPVPFLQ